LHWLAALEGLIVEKGAADRVALDARRAAWARAAEATPHGEPILLANDPQSQRSPFTLESDGVREGVNTRNGP
jgi:hypothetical protein